MVISHSYVKLPEGSYQLGDGLKTKSYRHLRIHNLRHESFGMTNSVRMNIIGL